MAEAISEDPLPSMGVANRMVIAQPQPGWYEEDQRRHYAAIMSQFSSRGFSAAELTGLAQIAQEAQAQGHSPEQVTEAVEKIAPGLLSSTGLLTKENLGLLLVAAQTAIELSSCVHKEQPNVMNIYNQTTIIQTAPQATPAANPARKAKPPKPPEDKGGNL